MATDLPPHDALADDQDELDWDREAFGPMADAATPPHQEPATAPMTPQDARQALTVTEG